MLGINILLIIPGACFMDSVSSDGSNTYNVIPNVLDMYSCQYKCNQVTPYLFLFVNGKKAELFFFTKIEKHFDLTNSPAFVISWHKIDCWNWPKDPNCTHFTYGKLDQYCYLKKGNGIQVPALIANSWIEYVLKGWEIASIKII